MGINGSVREAHTRLLSHSPTGIFREVNMFDETKTWAPVVAERERSNEQPSVAYPCRGPYNSYLGCVGASRCRMTGITMCILGRWPDERQTGSRPGRAPAELSVLRRS